MTAIEIVMGLNVGKTMALMGTLSPSTNNSSQNIFLIKLHNDKVNE